MDFLGPQSVAVAISLLAIGAAFTVLSRIVFDWLNGSRSRNNPLNPGSPSVERGGGLLGPGSDVATEVMRNMNIHLGEISNAIKDNASAMHRQADALEGIHQCFRGQIEGKIWGKR